jgi:Ras GTPase-activating-like protein IQGAP2/3
MLNQVSVGKLFAEENPYLAPLNEYINLCTHRFQDWFFQVLDVPDAETQFSADEYLDHSLPHKPIIYISPNEIYSMHSLVLQNLDSITEGSRDPLRALLGELGGAPLPASAELDHARAGEIAMTLKGKFDHVQDPHSEEKALFAATKRYVLYLLKVQPADNLVVALIEEVTPQHEEAWMMVVREELASTSAQMERRVNSSPNLGSGPAMEDVRGCVAPIVGSLALGLTCVCWPASLSANSRPGAWRTCSSLKS